ALVEIAERPACRIERNYDRPIVRLPPHSVPLPSVPGATAELALAASVAVPHGRYMTSCPFRDYDEPIRAPHERQHDRKLVATPYGRAPTQLLGAWRRHCVCGGETSARCGDD